MNKRRAKTVFLVAVFLELVGNFVITYTDGFTNPLPSIICLGIYTISAILFGFSLKELNLGIAYAVWSGVGIIFLAIVSVFWFHLTLNRADLIGIAMIIVGVIGVDLYGTEE